MFIPENIYESVVQYCVVSTVDFIFLNSDKKILLGLRNNEPLKGEYHLPGGRIEKNETMIQAATRKAKEELNIDIDSNKVIFVGVYDDMFHNSAFEGISSHYLPITFAYSLSPEEEKNITPDSQHTAMGFFAYDDESLNPFLKKRLQDIQLINNIF